MDGPQWLTRVGLGQDSHRFSEEAGRPLVLAGLVIPDSPGLAGNSDADLLFHALTNAISSITGRNILGAVADAMCRAGITDSRAYLEEALGDLAARPDCRPVHLAVSIEARRPILAPHVEALRAALAEALGLELADVGLTATSGEGLTAVGRGEGMAVTCVLTVVERREAAWGFAENKNG